MFRQKGFNFLIILLIAVAIGASAVIFIKNLNPSAQPQIPTRKEVNLPVKILPTSYGIDIGQFVFEYPKTVKVNVSEKFVDNIQAYGVGEKIVIGPKGWIGNGSVGADGNSYIQIYPSEKDAQSGPLIITSEIPACIGCALEAAAPFFSQAAQQLKANFDMTPIVISGLKISKIDDSLVKYTISSNSTRIIKIGVARFAQSSDKNALPYYFLKEEITLGNLDSDFANELLDIFIEQHQY